MNALLDVPEIRARVSPLSLAEYHRLGEFNEHGRRTELIRGILIEKMSKSPLQNDTIEELRQILTGQITPGLRLRQEAPLTLTDSEPEPDLAIVRGTRADFLIAHPSTAELVIEVAVSSLEIDRLKAPIYAEAGVKEYWIVCPVEKRVELYRQPGPLGYAERTLACTPSALESFGGIKVDLGALFA